MMNKNIPPAITADSTFKLSIHTKSLTDEYLHCFINYRLDTDNKNKDFFLT